MCLPDLENLFDYLYILPIFLPNFPPISIPFSKEKHPVWIKLGAFYNSLPKIHPIYVIWAPSSLMKTPRSLYQISRNVPQKAGTYTYTMSMWEPPPGVGKVQIKITQRKVQDGRIKEKKIQMCCSAPMVFGLSQKWGGGRDVKFFCVPLSPVQFRALFYHKNKCLCQNPNPQTHSPNMLHLVIMQLP